MKFDRIGRFVSQLCFALALLCSIGGPSHALRSQSVADGYTSPTITLPYAWKRPTLDGVIHEEEWQGAASLNALQTTNRAVSTRQTRFWLMWDEDNLYVAMRSPLRAGERLIQALRARDHDINAVFDDAYEIWLDVGTQSDDGQPVFFQYLSNFAGARYDVMQEPAVGNSRIGWTAGWTPHNRLTPDGRYWEMEMAIPRRSLYKNSPFADGFTFRGLLARDYKRPWEQNTIAGSGSFSVRETYAHFVLSKSAPAVHLLGVANPEARTLGLQLAVYARMDQTLRWLYESDGAIRKEGELKAIGGQWVQLPAMLDLDSEGAGSFRIRVTTEDERTTYLDWSAHRQWGDFQALTEKLNDTGDRVNLSLELNPVRDYLRVKGDFIDYDARKQIDRCTVKVEDNRQHCLMTQRVDIDDLAYANAVLHLPRLVPGEYTAELEALGHNGQALLTRQVHFTKKDSAKEFPWWNTQRGDSEKALAPWTPVTYRDGCFGVSGRTLRPGPAGLPEQITTRGKALLASPAVLEAQTENGTIYRAQGLKLRTVSQQPQRVVFHATSVLGELSVSSRVTVEYDGMMKIEMRLDPHKATSLRSLQVIVPLRADAAEYLHACGEGIRYGFDYRFLPRHKRGRIWDSRAVDGQPMAVGSFIPYVWIGNTQGGLCWFADSDEGWEPNDRVPALEVRRDTTGSVNLVLNLISAPVTVRRSRRIVFAFQATPVKPIFASWRMDTWWTGDSFKDWAQVESKGNAGNMGLIFSSLPFPLDPAESRRMVEERHKEASSIVGVAGPQYRANAVPYFEHINMGDRFAPAMNYFEEEWRTQVSRGLSYGKTLTDFMVYNVSRWAETCGIDGFYLDNIFPIADNNLEAGRGYRLSDGRVQPAYQIFDTRRYLLRLRAALAEQGKQNKLVLHLTNHLIAPWMGAADIALDGEHHVIYPEMNRDFMDFWSLERLRMDCPMPWGIAVNFLQEYQGNWEPARLKKVMRAYTGMLLLNDVLASANANSLNPEVWIAREQFGITVPGIRFLGYWDTGSGIECKTKDVNVSGWLKPTSDVGRKRLLLAVVNRGDATKATFTLEAARLGLPYPSQWKVKDAETQESLEVDAFGTVHLPVARHDYRQVVVELR